MVISLHKFFATTSINMRTAVVYIKTQRWMFNQSCMNIFGLPHSWGKREFFVLYVCMRSMHKTLLWFWMKVWTESICKLFDLTKRSLQGQRIVDTYIFFVFYLYLELEIFTSKVRKFFRCFVRIWQLLFRKVIQ